MVSEWCHHQGSVADSFTVRSYMVASDENGKNSFKS